MWFGCDTDQQSDDEHGVWAKHLHDYEAFYGVEMDLDKAQRLRLHESMMTHAMVFTGADIAEEGAVQSWRVENSWGPKKADKGFWTMADDWFDEFVFEIAGLRCAQAAHIEHAHQVAVLVDRYGALAYLAKAAGVIELISAAVIGKQVDILSRVAGFEGFKQRRAHAAHTGVRVGDEEADLAINGMLA